MPAGADLGPPPIGVEATAANFHRAMELFQNAETETMMWYNTWGPYNENIGARGSWSLWLPQKLVPWGPKFTKEVKEDVVAGCELRYNDWRIVWRSPTDEEVAEGLSRGIRLSRGKHLRIIAHHPCGRAGGFTNWRKLAGAILNQMWISARGAYDRGDDRGHAYQPKKRSAKGRGKSAQPSGGAGMGPQPTSAGSSQHHLGAPSSAIRQGSAHRQGRSRMVPQPTPAGSSQDHLGQPRSVVPWGSGSLAQGAQLGAQPRQSSRPHSRGRNRDSWSMGNPWEDMEADDSGAMAGHRSDPPVQPRGAGPYPMPASVFETDEKIRKWEGRVRAKYTAAQNPYPYPSAQPQPPYPNTRFAAQPLAPPQPKAPAQPPAPTALIRCSRSNPPKCPMPSFPRSPSEVLMRALWLPELLKFVHVVAATCSLRNVFGPNPPPELVAPGGFLI